MKPYTLEIDPERRYEVMPFVVDYERQVTVRVKFLFNSWGKWVEVHEATVAGVTNSCSMGFWFPAHITDDDFPEVLRENALRAVNEAWALAFPAQEKENHGT